MIKAVVFDLDGTLLDSMGVWDSVAQQYLSSYQIQVDQEIQDILATYSLIEVAQYLTNRFSLLPAKEDVLKGIEAIVYEQYHTQIKAKEGVQQCIATCHAQGLACAVLTANSEALTMAALKNCQLMDMFSLIMTCDHIGRSKRDPAIYIEVAKQLGVSLQECIFIEDALYAIQTIKHAGAYVIGVYDEANKADWKTICEVSDQHFISLSQWEVPNV